MQDSSPNCAQQNIAPQLSLGPAQHEKKHRYAQHQTKKHVQHGGQARETDPKGPQQVVHQCHRHSQQDGLREQRQLLGDVDAHGTHPSSLRKKPGRCDSPSS